MIYTTTLPEISAPRTMSAEFHDYAQVFADGKYIGKVDRVKNEKSISLPAVKKGTILEIIVEGMGRINFGRAIKDYKGIIGDVSISANIDNSMVTWRPKQWKNIAVPDDYEWAKSNFDAKESASGLSTKPGYYRGYFNLSKIV